MIGQRVGSYQVLSLVGEGGMGAVYLAQHVVIGRRAAIKVLRQELAGDAGVVARFINEARAANAIGHPNIIDILDVGTLPDGIPYLLMEFLAGESLGRRLGRVGVLPLDRAVGLTCQAASALAAAHAKAIVHRDLKPENLFLVPDPHLAGGERIKVLDFGIAKLQGGLLAAGGPRTRPGALIGTPQYMSPEQCRALPEEVGPASDTYSLGLILYEMVCGSPPFVGPSDGDLVVKHATESPPPPRSLNPDLPVALERIVLRALEKRPQDRFPSMDAFREALLGAAPTIAAPPVADRRGDTVPVTTPARRRTTLSSSAHEMRAVTSASRRRWVMAGTGAALVLAASLAFLFTPPDEPPRLPPAPSPPSAAAPPPELPPAAAPSIPPVEVPAPPAPEVRPDDREQRRPRRMAAARHAAVPVVAAPAPPPVAPPQPPDAAPPRALPEKW